MRQRYGNSILFGILMLVALSTSGCYTVLRMRTDVVPQPRYDVVEEYEYWDECDYWYTPLYMYSPYAAVASSWYYSPYMYWCYESYRPQSAFWRTGYSSPTAETAGGTSFWQESTRRRGLDTQTSIPRSSSEEGYTTQVRRSDSGEQGTVKTLRRKGTSSASQLDRRSGLPASVQTSQTTSGPATPTVSRGSSTTARPSSKAPAPTKSSSSNRRRGSGQ